MDLIIQNYEYCMNTNYFVIFDGKPPTLEAILEGLENEIKSKLNARIDSNIIRASLINLEYLPRNSEKLDFSVLKTVYLDSDLHSYNEILNGQIIKKLATINENEIYNYMVYNEYDFSKFILSDSKYVINRALMANHIHKFELLENIIFDSFEFYIQEYVVNVFEIDKIISQDIKAVWRFMCKEKGEDDWFITFGVFISLKWSDFSTEIRKNYSADGTEFLKQLDINNLNSIKIMRMNSQYNIKQSSYFVEKENSYTGFFINRIY